MDAVYGVIKPGATCGDLVRAAGSVEAKHSLRHFYLGHGAGCDSSEAPFIGSDLGGIEFDDTVELAEGMVFVLEPVIWRDGVGGYRSEEIKVVVTDGSASIGSPPMATPLQVTMMPSEAHGMTELLGTPNLGHRCPRTPGSGRFRRPAPRPPPARPVGHGRARSRRLPLRPRSQRPLRLGRAPPVDGPDTPVRAGVRGGPRACRIGWAGGPCRAAVLLGQLRGHPRRGRTRQLLPGHLEPGEDDGPLPTDPGVPRRPAGRLRRPLATVRRAAPVRSCPPPSSSAWRT